MTLGGDNLYWFSWDYVSFCVTSCWTRTKCQWMSSFFFLIYLEDTCRSCLQRTNDFWPHLKAKTIWGFLFNVNRVISCIQISSTIFFWKITLLNPSKLSPQKHKLHLKINIKVQLLRRESQSLIKKFKEIKNNNLQKKTFLIQFQHFISTTTTSFFPT